MALTCCGLSNDDAARIEYASKSEYPGVGKKPVLSESF